MSAEAPPPAPPDAHAGDSRAGACGCAAPRWRRACREAARQDRRAFADAQRQKMADLRSGEAPLFPVAHAHPSSQPFVQLRNRPVILGDAEVAKPATQILPELVEPVLHRDSPAPPGQFPDAMLEIREGGIRPAQFDARDATVSLRHNGPMPIDLICRTAGYVTRMSGGVGGRSREASSYPDSAP